MSRYADPTPTARAVLELIAPHSSMRPISQAVIGSQARTIAPPDEIHDALEQLVDARLVTSMRHTLNGVTQTVYWPTGLHPITAPTIEEIRMASEPKNSQLAALILQHGPISGTDLAAKAQAKGLNCPTKNVQGILGGHLTRGEIIMRKRNGACWYMTPNQAADEDREQEADAAIDADTAHVMSAPIGNLDEKAIPPADPVLLASANRMLTDRLEGVAHVLRGCGLPALENVDVRGDLQMHAAALAGAYQMARGEIDELKRRNHDLLNDVAAANLIFSQLAETLKVEKPEQIPEALDEMMLALSARAIQQAGTDTGRMALLLIDSGESDIAEVQKLDQYDAPNAAELAMRSIEQGHAARAMVVRIIGEAQRRVEWKEAA